MSGADGRADGHAGDSAHDGAHAGGIGSLAEEAARLLGALAPDLEEHLATGAPECTVCPVCRAVRALRGVSPEVRTHLVAAAASLAQAFSAAVAGHGEHRHGEGEPGHTGDPVEHIDLDADPGVEDDWDVGAAGEPGGDA